MYSSFASKVYGKSINKHDHPNERHVGKTCILGLGYGTGGAKLCHALATGLVKVNIPEAECKRIVDVYRTSYQTIPKLWLECQTALDRMYDGYDYDVGVGVSLHVSGKDRTIALPNGMKLRYPELEKGINERGYPEYTYRKGRFRNRIYGAHMVENLIQSLARIIVAYQMCKIKQALDKRSKEAADGRIRRVVHMVHDEVIVVVPEEERVSVMETMEALMSQPPAWAPTLPVSCEAGAGKTYKDAK